MKSTHYHATVFLGIGLLVFVSASAFAYKYYFVSEPQQIACTEEAKLCPDGSAVGRTGPNCEFAACPYINYFNDPKYKGWTLSQEESHCASFGGSFNSCGSACSGDGPCIQVCVPMCVFR